MSLILCEECGREISDKAKSCPHCGAPIEIAEKQGEIEKNLPKEETINNGKESVGTDKEHVKQSKAKLIIIICVVAAVAIAGTVFGVIKHKEAVAQKQYEDAVITMQGNAAEMYLRTNELMSSTKDVDSIEDLINLTNAVWHDAIWNESNAKTKKYVKGAKDFNEAVDNLYSSSIVSSFLLDLYETKDNVENEKFDCPEELLSVKDKYDDVVAAFYALVDFAKYPSGSYDTYMESAQEKFDEFNKAYNKFDSACPNINTDEDNEGEEE